MTLANLLLGLGIGLPMMIAVGPISVLLLDQGLERGTRSGAPAAFGVAGADLTLAALASIGGASLAQALGPFTPLLTMLAVLVLMVLAVQLGRSAMAEIRVARQQASAPSLVLAGAPSAGDNAESEPDGSGPDPAVGHPGAAFGNLTGARLAAAFYGLTMVNPLTLVLFASVVIAGGPGVGTAGWALGMALASLIAHGGCVVVGGALGARLSSLASGRLRMGAALFMGALAVHFALGA